MNALNTDEEQEERTGTLSKITVIHRLKNNCTWNDFFQVPFSFPFLLDYTVDFIHKSKPVVVLDIMKTHLCFTL